MNFNYKFLILLLLLPFIVSANDKSQMNPTILEDTINEMIPLGKCKFKGTVVDEIGNPMKNLDIKVHGSSLQKIKWDNSGTFEVLVDTTFSTLDFVADNYIMVAMNNLGFGSQHEITIRVNMRLNLIEPKFIQTETPVMTYKPVIYLYNELEIDVKLKLNPSGEFTFTYPAIEQNEWNVSVSKDGTKHNEKNYPYLFYETENKTMDFNRQDKEFVGHAANKFDIVDYLESSLTSMGLTQKEQTDFITFWAPRMTQHEQVFIQFWIDEEYDQVAKLEVAPMPESMKRIYIVYAPITDITPDHSEQTFKPFSRKGFTVIEWGGSELSSKKLQHKL